MTQHQYLEIINQEPPQVEQGDGYEYIKKSVLQQQLIDVYGGCDDWVMLRETVTKNVIYGVGILKVNYPVSGMDWTIEKTGTAAINLSDNKLAMDFPALEAMAFKNACKKLGRFFGMLLNIDKEDQEPVTEIPVVNIAHESITDQINACETTIELGALKPGIPSELMPVYLKRLGDLAKVNLKKPEDAAI